MILASFYEVKAQGNFVPEKDTAFQALNKKLSNNLSDTVILNKLNKHAFEFAFKEPEKSLAYSKLALRQANKLMSTFVSSQNGGKGNEQIKKDLNRSMALSYSTIGNSYTYQGDYIKAFPYFFKALKIHEINQDSLEIGLDYNNIGYAYIKLSKFTEALNFLNKAVTIHEKYKNRDGLANAYNSIGLIYWNQSNFPDALDHFLKALKLFEEIGNKSRLAKVYLNIGNINVNQQNYSEALKYYFTSLKIAEELGNKIDMGFVYNNIGNVYADQQNNKEALIYFEKSLKVCESIGDKEGIATSYLNIGTIYQDQGKLKQSLDNFFKALEIYESIGDDAGAIYAYSAISEISSLKKDLVSALLYTNKAMELAKSTGNRNEEKNSYQRLATIYAQKKDYKNAYEYQQLSVNINDSLFNTEKSRLMAEMGTKYESEKKQKEIELLNKDKELKESVLAKKESDIQKQTIQRNALVLGLSLVVILLIFIFRSYKSKQKANVLLEDKNASINKQNKLIEEKNVELEKLSIVARETVNGVIIADASGEIEWANQGFTRLFGYDIEEFKKIRGSNLLQASSNPEISKLIAHGVNEKKSVSYEAINITSSGKELWMQSTLTPILDDNGSLKKIVVIDSDITELKKAEKLILKKNRDITDSIEYAQRIQHAMLPSENEMKKYLNEFALFYAPKDIVSGDFYWLYGEENGKHKKIVVAVADCTGHGVPGALMSMIGSDQLNRIVREEKQFSPGKILTELNKSIKKAMQQVDVASKDGMEIGICLIDTEKMEICFAGANRPGYFFKNISDLVEINFDRRAIGGDTPFEYDFKEERFSYNVNDVLYLFSDGYADQFGGENRKKFLSSHFKQLLIGMQDRHMSVQEQLIKEKHISWKGKNIQIDDVTVLGMKLT